MTKEIQMDRILGAAIRKDASDIHIAVGKKPTLRIHGQLVELNTEPLSAEASVSAMKQITPEQRQVDLNENGGTDFATSLQVEQGEVRFRVSVTRDLSGTSIVMRRLPSEFLTPDQIGLPPQMAQLMNRERGLILVTGPTGSGKTTTLASLVRHATLNSKRSMVTFEDPIEYRFPHEKSVVRQREVGTHVNSFASGLRQVLRMDPNVILIGEMRDLETTRAALSAAETGHLVLSTLHTVSAAKTIDRLIEQFDKSERAQIRSQVSTGLLAVLCQQLIPRQDNEGRVAAFEFMAVTSGVANMIREAKTEQIEGAIQTGGKHGMQLLDDHLIQLCGQGIITRENALHYGNDKRRLDADLPRS